MTSDERSSPKISNFYHRKATRKKTIQHIHPSSNIVWYATKPVTKKLVDEKGHSMPESIIKIPWASFIKLRRRNRRVNGKRVRKTFWFCMLWFLVFFFFCFCFSSSTFFLYWFQCETLDNLYEQGWSRWAV